MRYARFCDPAGSVRTGVYTDEMVRFGGEVDIEGVGTLEHGVKRL